MKIFKYELPIVDFHQVEMPVGAHVLSVQEQHGKLCLWAAVNQVEETETRSFSIVGTGHYFNCDIESCKTMYIGTVQMAGGSLVWHVFDLG